jgi:hypothetical protein
MICYKIAKLFLDGLPCAVHPLVIVDYVLNFDVFTAQHVDEPSLGWLAFLGREDVNRDQGNSPPMCIVASHCLMKGAADSSDV